MLKVDGTIYDTNKVICRNISVFDASERGLLWQNILAQLRNFVEYIVQKVYSNGVYTDPNDYKDKKAAWEFVKTKGELQFLSKFHNLLKKSVSHYTFDEGGSERLMLKYYEYLLKIKVFLKEKYDMKVLENIDDFPLNLDDNLMEYYKQIAVRIVKPNHYAVWNPYNDREKLYLANTNPAVDNMRRKVIVGNCDFKTIAKFLSGYNTDTECDILFIDECSTVSNKDMRDILDKATFKLLVLVGYVFQIEAILFGSWFSIARTFVPETLVSELSKPYRSTNERLLTIWDRVRKLQDDILEPMAKGKYTVRLDESIFEHSEEDEIILCLNYDGLYSINNINRFLQSSNLNPEIVWGINTYKI